MVDDLAPVLATRNPVLIYDIAAGRVGLGFLFVRS